MLSLIYARRRQRQSRRQPLGLSLGRSGPAPHHSQGAAERRRDRPAAANPSPHARSVGVSSTRWPPRPVPP